VDDGHACVVQSRGEQRGVTRGGEYVPNLGRDELIDDGRIAFPAQDHQIGRDWPVGELAHPVQVGPALGGQRLDHAQTATLGDGSGQFGSRDIRHGRLDDGVLDVEQALDAVGHALILCYRWIAIGSAPRSAGKLPRGGVSERPKEHASKACDG